MTFTNQEKSRKKIRVKFRKHCCTILCLVALKRKTTGYIAALQNRIWGTARIINQTEVNNFMLS